jgi:hypothetical protein
MVIHKYIKRGLNHPNYCEDFVLHESRAEKFELFGVFDGCSSGTDSHFASAFIAKVIRSEFHQLADKSNLPHEEFLKKLLFNLIITLKEEKQSLNLEQNELLSTIILFLYDMRSNSGIIVSAGDGIVSINGEHTIIDEDNVPDYLAYHLDKINSEQGFKMWYLMHTQQYFIDDLIDVSISTDGASSFVQTKKDMEKTEELPDVLDYLFKDEFLLKNKAMLGRKCNLLERKHGLVNGDDLGIIRLVK